MLTLALDTTTKAGSVAVMQGDRLLAVIHGEATRSHGERLPEEIERAMRSAGVAPGELALLAVATGPGAFTGLRIGLATMQGLAMVIGCPVVGVSALDALAATVLDEADPNVLAVAPWMDAQRGEVFAAFYRSDQQSGGRPRAVSDPVVGAPDVLLTMLPAGFGGKTQFTGDGAWRYRAEIARFTGGNARTSEAPAALAPVIARIGQHLAACGQAGPPHALQPLYVRRPDAELGRDRRTTPSPVPPSTPSLPSRDTE